jgi:Tol biopolymer transport system component/DNA-binding winged helix-turn-helix (wHTH) protein
MSNEGNNLYKFGEFCLNGETLTLWRGDDLIPLSPKASELLKLLVERGGEIVSKREIFDKIWAQTFVEDGVLTQNIYTLRQVLGTDENGRQLIENVARRGYRFAAPIEISSAEKIEARIPVSPANNFFGEEIKHSSVETSEIVLPNLSSGGDPNGSTTVVKIQNFYGASPPNLVEKRTSHSNWQKVLAISVGALLLSAVGFGIYQFFWQSAGKNESKSAPIEKVRFQRLTADGDVIHPTISPSGELLIYVRQQEDGESLWLKPLATGNAKQVLPPSRKGYRSIAFSPDGNYLFFKEDAAPAAIYRTTPYGDAPKKVVDNVWGDFSVSPDGKQFAFFRRSSDALTHQLILSDLDGGNERQLSAKTLPSSYRSGAPAWSPDGKTLIASVSSNEEPRPLLFKIDVETGQETEFSNFRWQSITRYLWMPDGKNIVVTARAADESVSQIWLVGAGGGEVSRLTNDLENYYWLSLSADGKKLVTRQQIIVSHLWLLPSADLKNARQITFGERNHDGIRGLIWTKDEKFIFTAVSDTITDLYTVNADGKNRARLTANAGQDNTYPTATTDGQYIFFTSSRDNAGRRIWRMNADGRDQKQITFGEKAKESSFSAAVSPDGQEIYFINASASPSAIWKVSIDGGEPQPVSNLKDATAEEFLAISPDNKWLAYRHAASEKAKDAEEYVRTVGVLPTNGNAAPKLFNLLLRRTVLQWKADSSGFYYIAGTPNAATLQMQPLNGEAPQKILDFPDRIFNFAWSSDGKNLVVSRGKQSGDAILITNLP